MTEAVPRDGSLDEIGNLFNVVQNLQRRLALLERLQSSAVVLIETITGDGTTTSFDFQDIPQNYRNLLLVGQARMVEAINETEVNIRLNNDLGGNYHRQLLIAQDTVVAGTGTANATSAQIAVAPGNNATANYACQVEAVIANYSSTSFFKLVNSNYTMMRSTTLSTFDRGIWGNMWLSTVAVTRLTVADYFASNTYASGSLFALYGLM